MLEVDMQELLVLGLIPGTNIQITFGVWLIVMCMVAGIFFSHALRRGHFITSFIITAYLMRQTRQFQV